MRECFVYAKRGGREVAASKKMHNRKENILRFRK